jgi:hypothetical protein
MRHPHSSPSARDGNENLGQFVDERRLLLRREHQVAVALLLRSERRKNSAAHPEVRVTHVGTFFGTFKAKGDPSEIVCLHSVVLTVQHPASYTNQEAASLLRKSLPQTWRTCVLPSPKAVLDLPRGMVNVSCNPPVSLCRERVVSVQPREEHAACVFADQTKLLFSRFLAKSVALGDEITYPIPAPDTVGPEILVTKNAASGPSRYLYQAPIGYVSQPKQDKRSQHFVFAEVQKGSLSIGTIFLPCEVLREYFY